MLVKAYKFSLGILLVVVSFLLAILLLVACSSGDELPSNDDAASAEVDFDFYATVVDPDDMPAAEAVIMEQINNQAIDVEEIPATFEALCEANPDVCAWLYVPGTNVNLAVACDTAGDERYLKHRADGESWPFGSAFIEANNSTDFSDPVTVIYGHAFLGIDAIFTQLHLFGRSTFFDEHDKFYIVLPDRTLSYRIVSAFDTTEVDIIDTFNFSDSAFLQGFMNYVVSPDSVSAKVRDGISLDAGSDRLVVLSTCLVPASEGERFFVVGELIDG